MGDIEKPKGAYKFHVKSEHVDSLKLGLKKWIDKVVTVSEWREISDESPMHLEFPDDKYMGFVEEFSADVPESELIWFQIAVLNCPFCGQAPRVTWLPINGDAKERLFGMVICDTCDIMKTAEANKGEGQIAEFKAVAEWNTRTPMVFHLTALEQKKYEKAAFLRGYEQGSKDLLASLPK